VSGSDLKQLRRRMGLTQGQLGELIGVHLVSISRWETGTVPIPKTIALLMRLLVKDARRQSRKGRRG
jgi:transcriptional regulator with XRE-family HTH domain